MNEASAYSNCMQDNYPTEAVQEIALKCKCIHEATAYWKTQQDEQYYKVQAKLLSQNALEGTLKWYE